MYSLSQSSHLADIPKYGATCVLCFAFDRFCSLNIVVCENISNELHNRLSWLTICLCPTPSRVTLARSVGQYYVHTKDLQYEQPEF